MLGRTIGEYSVCFRDFSELLTSKLFLLTCVLFGMPFESSLSVCVFDIRISASASDAENVVVDSIRHLSGKIFVGDE